MIRQRTLPNGYIHTWSTEMLPVRNLATGDIYESAIDNPDNPHEYEEVQD